jgi:hypothetical protein
MKPNQLITSFPALSIIAPIILFASFSRLPRQKIPVSALPSSKVASTFTNPLHISVIFRFIASRVNLPA